MLRGLRTALIVLALACLGAGLSVTARPAFAQDQGLGLREAERSVVRIMVLHLDANDQPIALVGGSGFVVAPGKIVTNNHVVTPVEGSVRQLYYVVPDRFSGTEGKDAQLLQTWPAADLALLSAPEIAAPALKIAATPPGKEATVRALGYPGVTDSMRNLTLAKRLEPSEPYVTSGSIALFSDTAPGGAEVETIFHTAAIDHGNSGGPLIDECDRVIGVNTWGAADTLADDGQVESHQGQFAAIRSTVLAKFLDNSGVKGDIDYGPCVKAPTVDPAMAAEVDKANAAAAKALEAAQKAESDRDQILHWGVGLIALAAAVGALVMFLRWRQAAPVAAETHADGAAAPGAKKPLPIALWALLAVFVVALIGLWIMTHPKPAAVTPATAQNMTVTLVCKLDAKQSFNPVPGAASLTFGFDEPIACVNGRTPYEKNPNGGWSHITVQDKAHSVSKMELSSDKSTFTRRDFNLNDTDYAAYSAGRTSLGQLTCPIPNDAASAKSTADTLEKIRTLSASYLEVESSRVMTWHCEPQTAPAAAPTPAS
ncbi:MAG TPA: serine protease [Caulobacteraceae bacterium]|jgi:S1-C subfamily serine protease|nr:serine protease [Caulobacteraceae bacterium]